MIFGSKRFIAAYVHFLFFGMGRSSCTRRNVKPGQEYLWEVVSGYFNWKYATSYDNKQLDISERAELSYDKVKQRSEINSRYIIKTFVKQTPNENKEIIKHRFCADIIPNSHNNK